MENESNLKMTRIWVLADSRGRNLAGLLNVNDANLLFTVNCYPGASIQALAGRLRSGMDKYDMVVILGGICSVTKICHMPYRAAVVRYETPDAIMEGFMSECKELTEMTIPGLSLPVLLTPIVGMDLIRYAGHYCEELYVMQRVIDSTVPRINTFIKEANDMRGLITPNMSSCTHWCRGSGKGY